MGVISPIPTDNTGQPKATGSMQQLGRDDFLQLLVTKLQYQDPMKPMEDQDFVAQLAQFSSLEQMNNIADGISTSNEWDFLQMQSINNMMAAGLVGKEVTASYSGIYFDGHGEPTIAYETTEFADRVELVIKDSSGSIVNKITKEDLPPGVNSFKWDGKDSFGNRVSEGSYTVEINAFGADGSSFKPSLSIVGTVSEIRYREGAAYLLVNGTEIPLGDISAIGENKD